ncbi:hypothetical protein [Rhizobium rhizogenes]|uniref:Uncharacterized protein n=1 Tax=Rhizobium rhizogenes NBRC 13257 TaxID=1220581 RepID=A0AA87UC86_RHIRH|nr:hypothetical protein [Rhizobium rhizogenes]NTG71242.1 hypothetical protein [Rhizobium rhizogenes]NTG90549.1 hypothetical protein [Rhizobium rhizogenes]TRB03356.1 hypothetical protein EXN67_28940 [Rhizobium rhizogenes]TRB38098.1 hypothetical protein EXN73_28505 [Rhizobium rhizogenes]TRB53109.1 hypothetical protein EXN71_28490 [Rhizobium rhizogenes]
MPKFDKIESVFQSLMEATKFVLSKSECAEIQEYIDVGEYGLALRAAVAIYAEENKVASIEARISIGRLAEAMKIDPKQLLDRLPK